LLPLRVDAAIEELPMRTRQPIGVRIHKKERVAGEKPNSEEGW
jgi:hypothetical protein